MPPEPGKLFVGTSLQPSKTHPKILWGVLCSKQSAGAGHPIIVKIGRKRNKWPACVHRACHQAAHAGLKRSTGFPGCYYYYCSIGRADAKY